MGQPSSDSAFEIFGACVHSLRFALGAPVGYPDTRARLTTENPPDALFRRLTVASPPPGRLGRPWWTGLMLDGKPYQPDVWDERLAEVEHEDGIPSLDTANPDTVVLNRVLTMPRRRQKMSFPGTDRHRFLCSIFYWTGIPPNQTKADRVVEYHATFELEWDRTPEDEWVALSLDGFWPPERDSGDIIIPLRCTEECPR